MRLFNDMVSAILDLRQAGDLPRQRHAHRRRPGDRHGLRLLRRPGPGDLRPGRPAARLGARRRQHGLPAALRRQSRRRWRAARSASSGARTRRYRLGLLTRIVPGAEGRRRFRAEPAGRDRPLARRHGRARLRRAQEGRGPHEAKKSRWRAGPVDLSRLDREVDAPRLPARHDHAGLSHQDHRERAQAQARALGPQPRDQPGLARPQHDDRGPRGLPRVPRGNERPAARSISCCCAGGSPKARSGPTSSSRRACTKAHGMEGVGPR